MAKKNPYGTCKKSMTKAAIYARKYRAQKKAEAENIPPTLKKYAKSRPKRAQKTASLNIPPALRRYINSRPSK